MALLPSEPWRRNQWVMAATVFVVFSGFAFVLPFLPLYVRDLGVADPDQAALWAGVLIGVSPLLAGLMAPFWGRLADRRGAKRIALVALASYVVLLLLSAFVTSVGQLLALRIGVGLFGAIGPLGLVMAAALSPREETGRAVGLVQSAQILAAAAGPLAGGLLADAAGIRATFVVTAAVCGVAFSLVALYYVGGPPKSAPDRGGEVSLGGFLAVPRAALILLVLFFVNFIGKSFIPILPLYMSGLGIPEGRLASATGVLISAYSVAAAVSASLLGRASGRRDPRVLLIASIGCGAALVLAMAFVSSYTSFVALAVVLGLTAGGALTLSYTIGGLLVEARHRGAAFGYFSSAALFGGAISPSVAGLLARWGLRGIFYMDAGLYVLLALALLSSVRRPLGSHRG
jgi:MFS transporter, DHA1 family, multidrug resistance protein